MKAMMMIMPMVPMNGMARTTTEEAYLNPTPNSKPEALSLRTSCAFQKKSL